MNRLLLATELDEEQQDFAKTMLSSADSLMTLLNEILDLSTFQSTRLKLEEIEFDLRTIVEDCCDLVSEKVQSKDLELVGSVAENLFVQRIGDSGRIRQVVLNFLTNAVKLADTGEVLLRAERDGAGPNSLRIAVTDSGIGIGKASQQAVGVLAIRDAAILAPLSASRQGPKCRFHRNHGKTARSLTCARCSAPHELRLLRQPARASSSRTSAK